MIENQSSRREFIKKTAYVVPAVLTLDASLAHARTGSQEDRYEKKHKHKHKFDRNDRATGLSRLIQKWFSQRKANGRRWGQARYRR